MYMYAYTHAHTLVEQVLIYIYFLFYLCHISIIALIAYDAMYSIAPDMLSY